MDFLEVMNGLFAMQKTFPSMTWCVSATGLNVRIDLSDENIQMLMDAQQLFD